MTSRPGTGTSEIRGDSTGGGDAGDGAVAGVVGDSGAGGNLDVTTATGLLVAVEGIDGAGKSTLVRALEKKLLAAGSRASKPARVCVEIFRAIAEPDDSVLYQHVIPGPMRRLAQLVELTAQLHYRSMEGPRPDLLFDRWVQTARVYCGPYGAHRDWLEQVEDLLPRPDPLLWVRVPAELAYERLVARGDRWTRVYTPAALRRRLADLADGYEQVMADADNVVVLDGSAPRELVLNQAMSAVAAAQPAVALTATEPAVAAGSTVSEPRRTPGEFPEVFSRKR